MTQNDTNLSLYNINDNDGYSNGENGSSKRAKTGRFLTADVTDLIGSNWRLIYVYGYMYVYMYLHLDLFLYIFIYVFTYVQIYIYKHI
jgi:hypothetical protein